MQITTQRGVSDLVLPYEALPKSAKHLGLSERAGMILGVFAYPKETILSIRAWNDALEGTTDTCTWALFEAEKLARMMLRQSVLAFETIAGKEIGESDLWPDLNWTVTQGLVDELLNASKGALTPARGLLLAASALALTKGSASTDPEILQEVLGESLEFESPKLNEKQSNAFRVKANERKNVLPDRPSGYDALDGWVVRSRLLVD